MALRLAHEIRRYVLQLLQDYGNVNNKRKNIRAATSQLMISKTTAFLQMIVSFFRKKEIQWYEPEDPTPREQCPCCDYISLPERGNFLICPICFWEDDGQDLDELDVESGPNHYTSLRQGRNNFKEFGACEFSMKQYVLSEEDRNGYTHRPRDA